MNIRQFKCFTASKSDFDAAGISVVGVSDEYVCALPLNPNRPAVTIE